MRVPSCATSPSLSETLMSSSQDKSHEGSAGSKLRSKVEEEEENDEEEVTVATVGEEGGGDLCVQEAATADCPGAERGPLESAARRGPASVGSSCARARQGPFGAAGLPPPRPPPRGLRFLLRGRGSRDFFRSA